MNQKGLFIVVEGINGAGKTTLIQNLKRLCNSANVVFTKEPYKLQIQGKYSAHGEAVLYAADRFLHIDEVIRPALDKGNIVICDRYIDSSIVYQGVVGGLGKYNVRFLNSLHSPIEMQIPKPDLTIFVNTDLTHVFNRLVERYSIEDPKDCKEWQNLMLKLTNLFCAYCELYKGKSNVYYTGSLNTSSRIAADVWREITNMVNILDAVRSSGPVNTSPAVESTIQSLQKAVNVTSSELALLEQLWLKKFDDLQMSVNEINQYKERLDQLEKRLASWFW